MGENYDDAEHAVMNAHDPDLMRRIEMERADAKRKALEDVIEGIRNHKAKGKSYSYAFKAVIKLIREKF